MQPVDRTTAMLGLGAGLAGAMFVLFFWIIAAISYGRGMGFISQLELSGLWMTGFWAYPFVLFAATAAALIAFFAKAHQAAVALAGLPVAGVVLYYVALVTFY